MKYNYCGKSGLQLPQVSLGMWHNFGSVDNFDNSRSMLLTAFEEGITHFDLANNYGPIPGSAELTFGKVLKSDLAAHRDELVISSKAGYTMWNEGAGGWYEGSPYGDGGSRKYLIASCEQSLKRTGLDYFDIFYSHRYDPNTPIEETMQALVDIVRSGKALYAGISNYPVEQQKQCYDYLKAHDVPCLISQYKANLLQQETLFGQFPAAKEAGSGFITFCPLAQGLLTDRYFKGIPAGSRATKGVFLKPEQVSDRTVRTAIRLNELAAKRGQSLAQMALAWLLHFGVTSVLIGASSVAQLKNNIGAVDNTSFTAEEIAEIDRILKLED
ncbi:MAG: aldo/keto reductase [Bacteroidales bacterium]|nr:aldo/keto reductase [Candidatus Colicola faecequi]